MAMKNFDRTVEISLSAIFAVVLAGERSYANVAFVGGSAKKRLIVNPQLGILVDELFVEFGPAYQQPIHRRGALEKKNSSIELGKARRNIRLRIALEPVGVQILFVRGSAIEAVEQSKQLRERLSNVNVGVYKNSPRVRSRANQFGLVVKAITRSFHSNYFFEAAAGDGKLR